jgi:hypothetical protein
LSAGFSAKPKLWREDEDEVNVMKRSNKSEKRGTKKLGKTQS